MLPLFAALAFFALAAAILFLRLAHIERAATGLPFDARIVYADTGAWRRVEQPLFTRRYALAGKPDYVVEQNESVIPVEVKPNRTAPAPRDSDVMQLAAYGLLVEETMARGRAVPYGLLKYRDAVFQIDFTDKLRADLIDLMESMRCDVAEHDVARSHTESRRCRACGYRAECDQALPDNGSD
jgi:CRISPR-associated exonuclease Cas4